MYGKNCSLRMLSHEYNCLAKKLALRKRSRCYWKTRTNVKGQHALTGSSGTDNQRQKYMKKNHLLLQILAVIGRYGSHLMIVMIFVTQNNFLNGMVQEFLTVSLDFTPKQC